MKSGFYPQLVSWIGPVMALKWGQSVLDGSENGDECTLGLLRLARPACLPLNLIISCGFITEAVVWRPCHRIERQGRREKERGIFHPVYWKCGVSDTLQTVCAATMHMRRSTCQNIQLCSRGPRPLSTLLPFATRNSHLHRPWKSSKSWHVKTNPQWQT